MLINYQKRKNLELFNSLAKPNSLFMSEMQNYIPIYKKIIFQDKEYFYDDKPNGVVFEADEKNVSKIVGYIDISTKSINFM